MPTMTTVRNLLIFSILLVAVSFICFTIYSGNSGNYYATVRHSSATDVEPVDPSGTLLDPSLSVQLASRHPWFVSVKPNQFIFDHMISYFVRLSRLSIGAVAACVVISLLCVLSGHSRMGKEKREMSECGLPLQLGKKKRKVEKYQDAAVSAPPMSAPKSSVVNVVQESAVSSSTQGNKGYYSGIAAQLMKKSGAGENILSPLGPTGAGIAEPIPANEARAQELQGLHIGLGLAEGESQSFKK